jgi:hypothetical protein
MIEYLMGFVDELEREFKEVSGERKEFNGRYLTLIGMKKFILEDMLVYFIDRTVEGLKGHKPCNFLVETERNKLLKFCRKYQGDYLKPEEIMDYFDKECQSNYEKVKKQREIQRNYLKRKQSEKDTI